MEGHLFCLGGDSGTAPAGDRPGTSQAPHLSTNPAFSVGATAVRQPTRSSRIFSTAHGDILFCLMMRSLYHAIASSCDRSKSLESRGATCTIAHACEDHILQECLDGYFLRGVGLASLVVLYSRAEGQLGIWPSESYVAECCHY